MSSPGLIFCKFVPVAGTMQWLASSKALVSPVLEAALRLTHLGWSRVSVGPDEGGQDDDDDDDGAAEGGREGREGRTGHRAASSPLTASCFACCRRRLGLVQGGLTRRLCCSSCGSARCTALRHCRHGSDLVGHLLSRRASSTYPLHVQMQPPSTSPQVHLSSRPPLHVPSISVSISSPYPLPPGASSASSVSRALQVLARGIAPHPAGLQAAADRRGLTLPSATSRHAQPHTSRLGGTAPTLVSARGGEAGSRGGGGGRRQRRRRRRRD